MVRRGESGRRARLLEEAAGRNPGAAGVAGGQTAAAGADLRGGGLPCEAERRAGGGIEAIEPEQSGDPVYDAAGWLRSIDVPLQRTGRHSGGISDSQPAGGAVGGADGVLRQHAGHEGEGGEGEEFRRVAGRCEAGGARGLSASGRAVRAAGGGNLRGAGAGHDAPRSSGLRPGGCARRGAAGGGEWWRGRAVGGDELSVRFDLEAHAWERGEEIEFYWIYNRGLFDRWRMEQMTRHYLRVLEAVVSDPEQRIGRVELLEERERQQILEGWNETAREMPEATLADLFEEQARRAPDAVAVVFAEESLTYRGLKERAGDLAYYLTGRGVGAEVVVGICMERSLEMMAAVLGVLKAGGAYLPLDLGYPRERLGLMMEDCGVSVLL